MCEYSNTHNEMIEEIKAKRELMINSANTQGFTNEMTIKYSQELDELINEYQKVMDQISRPNEEIKFAFKQMIMIWPKVLV
ncbi:stage 0 sporulation regulatory protein [Neobacillus sp. B4I6]|uniref:aspartyl-phosphate phosphatase Spo0E family protein n=1 Tax=Bacillaceae TaxID=186817 RepID=UPI001BE53A1A|nr:MULTISPECIES: aspartyl-phosphate phosphatase Spo0E family protein [unclassified Bacillus (in: firmicutes)]MBT2697019.1 aspartyl-phosphate phosphatase Spo0E family protein [Bacillus sp. ISL-40]MBT2722447.1 aspartyl-phosphate phosphatase Spo0E family protein [Bacillus sp. ISL-46]MBT2734907.1 aspartyl-phosphate phosphatase Spo0E family protein [Bacillus sp. ISL-7]MBT2741429.1 aspartyl-phosphate phosphatase Spo0E family protein [Bacillus sp. ISL-77]